MPMGYHAYLARCTGIRLHICTEWLCCAAKCHKVQIEPEPVQTTPEPHDRGGGTKVKGPAPVVVKCNVGRYHGTIVAQRTVFFTAQRHASAVCICHRRVSACLFVSHKSVFY